MADKPRPSAERRLLDEWTNERTTILERIRTESHQAEAERLVGEHETKLGLHPPAAIVRRVR